MTPTVAEVEAVLAQVVRLRDQYQSELDAMSGHRLSPGERGPAEHRQQAIWQLTVGVDPLDGVLPEMADLLHSEPAQRLRLRAIGITPLTRLLAQLQQVVETPSPPPAGQSRLRPGLRHSLGDRDLTPGEEINLTPEQAAAWGDKFEFVGH